MGNKTVDQLPLVTTLGSTLSLNDKVMGWDSETGKSIKIPIQDLANLLAVAMGIAGLSPKFEHHTEDDTITPVAGKYLILEYDPIAEAVTDDNMTLAGLPAPSGSKNTYIVWNQSASYTLTIPGVRGVDHVLVMNNWVKIYDEAVNDYRIIP